MDAAVACSPVAARALMERFADGARLPATVRIVEDTTEFHRLESGDVLPLGGTCFWIQGCEREGRFGLDEEPKHWVRRAVDLSDGSTKVVKLVFREEFETRIGDLAVRRFRSPRKEARILDLVRGHDSFMQGSWAPDAAGNVVRVLEFIRGRRWDELVAELGADHEDYFHRHFPGILDRFVELIRAVKFLHDRGEKHGDIRRDHILWERAGDRCRWIDFDYDYVHGESLFSFDLQGLGNVLIFLAARGDVLVPEVRREQPALYARLERTDLNISWQNRVANLRKVYPYVPESLNQVLLHFSAGATLFYDSVDQLLEDLAVASADVGVAAGRVR